MDTKSIKERDMKNKATPELVKFVLKFFGMNITIESSALLLDIVNTLNIKGDQAGLKDLAEMESRHNFEIKVRLKRKINKRNHLIYRLRKF